MWGVVMGQLDTDSRGRRAVRWQRWITVVRIDKFYDLVFNIGEDGLSGPSNTFRSVGKDHVWINARKGILRRARQMDGGLVVWGHGGHEGHSATCGRKRQSLIAKRTVEKVELAAQLGQGAWRDVVAKGEEMVAIAHVVLFVDPHGMSVFYAWHKAPAPMEKELVVVRT